MLEKVYCSLQFNANHKLVKHENQKMQITRSETIDAWLRRLWWKIYCVVTDYWNGKNSEECCPAGNLSDKERLLVEGKGSNAATSPYAIVLAQESHRLVLTKK